MIAILKQPERSVYEMDRGSPGGNSEYHGCSVNEIEIDELFEKYKNLNFLYDAKMQRLGPFYEQIKETWARAMAANLLKVFTYQDNTSKAWGSVVIWRSSYHGWWSQHLISAGNPIASRSVMLAAQKVSMNDSTCYSGQNWFRPDNKMPKRIFGSIKESLGSQCAAVAEYGLFEASMTRNLRAHRGHQLVECVESQAERIENFARRLKGDVYVEAEGLVKNGLNMGRIDRLYQQAGLRRYRKSWIVVDESDAIVAALIGYRGPLGMNFSFLENRADLMISPDVADEDAATAVHNLMAAASKEYSDFEPGKIPVITDQRGSQLMDRRGDRCIRKYCQSLWLREAYQAWYDHTDSFYSRILTRLERRNAQAH